MISSFWGWGLSVWPLGALLHPEDQPHARRGVRLPPHGRPQPSVGICGRDLLLGASPGLAMI